MGAETSAAAPSPRAFVMTLFCKDLAAAGSIMCVLLFGLGGLLVNPIVDVGDRLVKGCFWRLCSIWNLQVDDFRSEWPERKLGHLERLQSERNTDNGDAVEYAPFQIAERHPPADQHHPQDVGQGRADSAAVLHGFAKRRQEATSSKVKR